MQKTEPPAAALVVTALPLETRAVRSHLTEPQRRIHGMGDVFHVADLPGGVGRVALAATGEGNVNAALVASRAIEMFRPGAVFFVGVAGALKDDLELGDVVVATRVYAVHGAKEQDEGSFARPQAYEAGHELLGHARDLVTGSELWEAADPRGGHGAFRVHLKPIAAGEVVLNSRTSPLAQQLHAHYNGSAAIEMESAGVAQAAHASRGLPMLTVRGISDMADGGKDFTDAEDWQKVAATRAAEVAFAVIRAFAATRTPMDPGNGHTEHADDLPDQLIRASRKLARLLQREADDDTSVRGLLSYGTLPVEWELEGGADVAACQATPANGAGSPEDGAWDTGRSRCLRGTDEVAAAFRTLRKRRLVLLGDAGAGKSTLATLLVLHLVKTGKGDWPMPVPVSPETWDPDLTHMRDWFEDRLRTRYPEIDREFGPGTLRGLIDIGHVFPLFDGLDGLPRGARVRLLDVLNRKLTTAEASVITCRVAEYQDAVRNVEWAPGLVLRARPVQPETAARYLADSSPEIWRPVTDQLLAEPEGTLATTFTTPLMIRLARQSSATGRVRPGQSARSRPAALADRELLPDAGSVRGHLWNALLPATFDDPHPRASRVRREWKTEDAEKYLRFIARRFNSIGSRDLDWLQIAPQWANSFGIMLAITSPSLLGLMLLAIQKGVTPLAIWLIAAALCVYALFLCRTFAISLLGLFRPILLGSKDQSNRRHCVHIAGLLIFSTFLITAIPPLKQFRIPLAAAINFPVLHYGLRIAFRPETGADPGARMRRERQVVLTCLPYAFMPFLTLLKFTSPAHAALSIPGFLLELVAISVWGRWQCGRVVLCALGWLPWHTVDFLEDARSLGVLRLADGHHQFCHIDLQIHLGGGLEDRFESRVSTSAAEVTEVHWERGIPWKRRLTHRIFTWALLYPALLTVLICLIYLKSNDDIVVASLCFPLCAALLIPLVKAAETIIRCRVLGWSASILFTPCLIDATFQGRRIRVTPDQVLRITVRQMRRGNIPLAGHFGVFAIVCDGIVPPRKGVFEHGDWVLLAPLDGLHPVTDELTRVLEAFGGSKWEPPLRTS